jgi:hypothetical protein
MSEKRQFVPRAHFECLLLYCGQVNTQSARKSVSGVTHKPPVWSVSIDEGNKEQVDRYLKRQQKLPEFVAGVGSLAVTASVCARQNATEDIFEMYYEGDDGESLQEALQPSVQVLAVLR